MTFGWILKRMRREWRVLTILLFAVSLVTGFFALGPLYIRAVNEVDLRNALENSEPDSLLITFLADRPLRAEAQTIVEDELGDLVVGIDRYIRADYVPPDPALGGATGLAGIAVCGYEHQMGTNPLLGSQARPDCYQPFAFEDLASRVDLIEGRLPVRGPTPQQVRATVMTSGGLTPEEQQQLEVGIYSRGEVEAVVTAVVAEEADVEVGTLFLMGNILADGTGQLTLVKIVGIVSVKDPDDSFWDGNDRFVQGEEVDVDQFGTTRFDWGMAFHPVAYEDWVAPILPQAVDTNYIWRLYTDVDTITSDNADDIVNALQRTTGRISTIYPDAPTNVQMLTGLDDLIGGYGQRVDEAEGPIIFLSGAVLLLMLYHLITTVNLVLQQQGKEWSTISSRGGSTAQLFKLQLFSIFLLGLLSVGLGVVFSRLFLLAMEQIGPLAEALGGASLENVVIPTRSYLLAGAAAGLCIAVLSLPALPAARRSLLLLKQATSRPPTRPFWTKYSLDAVFIGIGIIFFLRMYRNVGGDFGNLLNDLFAAPDRVVKLIADNAAEAGGLTDPFNLAAPAFFLSGMALFWLRIFPTMMGGIARLTSRRASLTAPLAVWNVERNPGHYSQLVLLLIGTLALGTASLGLQATRDVGAWEVAQDEIGGSARVDLDATQGADAADVSWDEFDGVSGYAEVLTVQATSTQRRLTVIGVNPAQFRAAFPDYAQGMEGLDATTPITIPGIGLPPNARELRVQAWSVATGRDDIPDVAVVLRVYLIDAVGVPYVVELSQETLTAVDPTGQATPGADNAPSPTLPEAWVTLSGQLPSSGRAPYHIWRVGIASEQGTQDAFAHTVYLDLWQTSDENGIATELESFENEPSTWQPAQSASPYLTAWTPTTAPDGILALNNFQYVRGEVPAVVEGDVVAMKLEYTIRNQAARRTEPSIVTTVTSVDWIPVIVSEPFARVFRGNGLGTVRPDTPALTIGSQRTLALAIDPPVEIPTTQFGLGNLNVGVQVVGVVENFPTQPEPTETSPLFMVMPLDTMRLLFNQIGSPNLFYDTNQVWLQIPERQPTSALKAEIQKVPGLVGATYSWDRYGEILREPLPSAVAGMLFAGFWVSLGLSLLDFAFYIIVTAQQRSFTFGVLRSLGWNSNNIWRLLLFEQLTLVVPALIIGSLLGAGLAFLILPFLALVGGATLQLPLLDMSGLIMTLVVSFAVLLVVTALWLQRMSVNQILRLGEE